MYISLCPYRGFNPCRSVPNFFWLIIAFVTRADTLNIVVQIESGGKWCF